MKPKLLLAFVFVTLFIICLGILLAWSFHPNEELVSKREWSILQGVEFKYRRKLIGEAQFITVDGYSLVGVRGSNERKNIWIMLNPKNPPYYKQLPEGDYTLSERDLEEILASGGVTSTVEGCLKSHVNTEPNPADKQ